MKASKQEIESFLAVDFPQNPCEVLEVNEDFCMVRYPINEDALRPGGTVSGPAMFFAADVALYVAVLSKIGIVPLAVTSQITINFLRKPTANANLLAQAKLLKQGKTLLYGEVFIYSEHHSDPVAHAIGTYIAPSNKG